MSKSVCIHPNDLTTEFLSPVYQELMKFEDIHGISGDSSDDRFYDELINVFNKPDIESVIFLGHGYSSALYGNNLSELITEDELRTINDKSLILFACNSCQLMEKVEAKKGIGFGLIPSGQDDILHSPKFHDLDLSPMQFGEWDYLRKTYHTSWVRAIRTLDGMLDVYGLYKRLDLFLSRGIVDVLRDSALVNRELIANILFYVKKDMTLFGI